MVCPLPGPLRNALPAHAITVGKIPGGAGQKRFALHFVRIAAGRSRTSVPQMISAGKIPGGAGQKRFAPHFVRIAAGRSPVHKILTEIPIFVLAFSGRLGYDVLALRGKEC